MYRIIITNQKFEDLPPRLQAKAYRPITTVIEEPDMAALPIPEWPDGKTAEGATFFANARAIANAWKAKGVGNAFALGMLAQAEAESSLDPNAMGDHVNGEPTAYGLHQWHATRCATIKTGAGIDIIADAKAKRGTVESQVDCAWWELTKFPRGYGVNAISAAKTAYMAAYQACALFERAGAANAADRRGKMAERWSAYFAKNGF